ncbi:MAG: hypothetical protein ACE5IG_01020 [Dehalococcoidia bacterium]
MEQEQGVTLPALEGEVYQSPIISPAAMQKCTAPMGNRWIAYMCGYPVEVYQPQQATPEEVEFLEEEVSRCRVQLELLVSRRPRGAERSGLLRQRDLLQQQLRAAQERLQAGATLIGLIKACSIQEDGLAMVLERGTKPFVFPQRLYLEVLNRTREQVLASPFSVGPVTVIPYVSELQTLRRAAEVWWERGELEPFQLAALHASLQEGTRPVEMRPDTWLPLTESFGPTGRTLLEEQVLGTLVNYLWGEELLAVYGVFNLCYLELLDDVSRALPLGKCPRCGSLQALVLRQHRDRLCEPCRAEAGRVRVRRYRRRHGQLREVT